MSCRFCCAQPCAAHSELCAHCATSYSEETIELLYALTRPIKEGTAQETTS